MTTTWVTITPRDTVAVRDGRPFDAGAGSSARSVFPWPSTAAGAIGSVLGREVGSVRGPFLAHDPDSTGLRMVFATPADLYAEPGATSARRIQVSRLSPGVATDLGGIDDFPMLAEEGLEPAEGWLLSGFMTRYLADALDTDLDLRSEALPSRDGAQAVANEQHIGLTRTAQHTAEEGMLYSAHHLRLQDDLTFVCAVDDNTPPGPDFTASTRFGGESRVADVNVVTPVQFPAAPDQFPEGRVLLYLATPAIWDGGWRPPLPQSATLVTAALGDPVPVAMASPRIGRQRGSVLNTARIHWAVPAGSLYYLQFPSPEEAHSWVHGTTTTPGIHSRTLGDPPSRLSTAGFGVVLAGTWHPM